MNIEQLKKAADSLAVSSAFRYGDPSTFSVALLEHEVELPGPSDPKKYMDLLRRKLQLVVESGSSVAVVGAGNGGLVAELLSAGAAKALAIEPRRRFHDGLDRICALLRQVHDDDVVLTYLGWPKAGGELGPFDAILWPEGLDECTSPEEMLGTMIGLLAPGGRLVVEVTHGGTTLTSGVVNSFRPTEQAWAELLGRMGLRMRAAPGRLARRTIYELEAVIAKEDEAKAEAAAKAEAEASETLPAAPVPPPTPPADELPVERTVTTKKSKKSAKQKPAADSE